MCGIAGVFHYAEPARHADEALVLLNRGDLQFDPPLAFATGIDPQATAVGDLDGDGRIDVVTADLDETPVGGTVSILLNDTPAGVAGDTDGDGDVDIDDLVAVITAWGPCPPPPAGCAADANGDGQVNVDDLVIVIQGWGPAAP